VLLFEILDEDGFQAQANFTAEAQRTQRREKSYMFLSCSPSAAASVRAAAEGEQGEAKKKAVKSLANRSRYDLYARCFFRADCAI